MKHADPESILEKIAEIWQSVLRNKNVGIHDNFFDAGGHSLLLVQVQAKLQDVFQRKVSVIELFEYPTISALANHFGHET